MPGCELIESSFNLGFCAGNNLLVGSADGDAIVFLNNDTRPVKGWLAALVRALRVGRDDVAAVSGRILNWEGERLDFARGIMTFDGHAFQLDFGRRLGSARPVGDGEELLFPCGGNMIVKKQSFIDAGRFDEDYFAYLEDVDLGWRLWSGGERVTYSEQATVHHRSSATSNLLGQYNRGFLFERNAFLTAYKNYEEGLWQRIMPAVLLTLASRTQTMLVKNNRSTGTLTVNPYDGLIANTPRGAGRGVANSPHRQGSLKDLIAGVSDRWRTYGPFGFLRRAPVMSWNLLRRLTRVRSAREHPILTDQRTISQLRAQQWILTHLDEAASKRALVQQRRKRSDAEIFERFPLAVVPTYPGDQDLFASRGFRAWLPDDMPLRTMTLEDVSGRDDPDESP